MGKRRLVIVGAGGHGRSVAEAAMLCAAWNEIVFIDDAYPGQTSSGRWPIVAATATLTAVINKNDDAIIAIGNQTVRAHLFQSAEQAGASMVTVIHPKAWVSGDAVIGAGTAVMAGAIVGTQATIGRGAIINANATVDHDAALGTFAHLGVGVQLAGGVVVGDRAWLQAGSCAGYRVVVLADAVLPPGTVLTATD